MSLLADGISEPVDLTIGTRTTRRGVTGVRSLNTSLVLADEALATIIVSRTLWTTASDSIRLGDETRLAFTDGIVIRTHAASGSRTTGRGMAGISLGLARVILAHVPMLAVSISGALISTSSDGIRLGNESWKAIADRVTSGVHGASGAGSTGAGFARIMHHTSLVLALESTLTIGINDTFWPTSSDGIWLGDIAMFTMANWVSISALNTPGVRTTGRGVAGVGSLNTDLIPTDETIAAVRIDNTFRTTSRDGVRLGDQPRQALTNRISILVDRASGSRATGRGSARINWWGRGSGTWRGLGSRGAGVSKASVDTAIKAAKAISRTIGIRNSPAPAVGP